MPGVLVTDGQILVANLVFRNVDANRGSSLELGLFTNALGSLGEASTLSNIVEPTGGGYARIALVDVNWSVDGAGLASYPQQGFQAVGGNYSASINGYFIATTGTVPKLFLFEDDTVNGPYPMPDGTPYDVTPRFNVVKVP